MSDTVRVETMLALVLLCFAAVLALVGLAGLAGRLPGAAPRPGDAAANEAGGEASTVRRRRAAAALLAAAGPPFLLAALLLVRPPEQLSDWFLVYAAVGLVTGGLISLAVRQRRDDS